MNTAKIWDVVIAGGGPAGATTAALLAEAGVDTLVLERETFPRFHLGESLLPAVSGVLAHLGIEADPAVFVHKQGAVFISDAPEPQQHVSTYIDFADALPGPARHAWQVERATFDQLLVQAAQKRGAQLGFGVKVSADNLEVRNDYLGLETSKGRVRARYFIDASGQGRLMARRNRSIVPFHSFGKAASFIHFSQLSDAAWEQMAPTFEVQIISVQGGWGWVIPLPQRRLSIGFVTPNAGIQKEDVRRMMCEHPSVKPLLQGAVASPCSLVGNYSFRNQKPFGARFGCIGDAACFIDPVFSSGVSLAMAQAPYFSELLLAALREGKEADPEVMRPFAAKMQRAYEVFSALVYRFYHANFVDRLVHRAPQTGSMRTNIISVLAGDVFRDDNPFIDMLLRSRTRPPRISQVSHVSQAPQVSPTPRKSTPARGHQTL